MAAPLAAMLGAALRDVQRDRRLAGRRRPAAARAPAGPGRRGQPRAARPRPCSARCTCSASSSRSRGAVRRAARRPSAGAWHSATQARGRGAGGATPDSSALAGRRHRGAQQLLCGDSFGGTGEPAIPPVAGTPPPPTRCSRSCSPATARRSCRPDTGASAATDRTALRLAGDRLRANLAPRQFGNTLIVVAGARRAAPGGAGPAGPAGHRRPAPDAAASGASVRALNAGPRRRHRPAVDRGQSGPDSAWRRCGYPRSPTWWTARSSRPPTPGSTATGFDTSRDRGVTR